MQKYKFSTIYTNPSSLVKAFKVCMILLIIGIFNIPLFSKTQTKEDPLFKKSQQKIAAKYTDKVQKATYLELDISSLKTIYQNKTENLNLVIPNNNKGSFELELTQAQIITPDFVLSTSDGQHKTFQELPALFYQGKIKGSPNSTVAISIFKQKIKGLITNDEGNYVLSELPNETHQYVFYNDKNLTSKNQYTCGTSDKHNFLKDQNVSKPIVNHKRTDNCVEIYIECDYSMYQSHNSNLNKIQIFVLSLMNEVAVIYTNEDITVQLSEIHIWTAPDPYAVYSSTDAILEKFGEQTQDNHNGRLAHLLSTRNLGGGIAWLDVLCSNYSPFEADWDGDGIEETHHAGPYAFSANLSTRVSSFPTYSWNVAVFAHEMGHNFGSPHTQNCSWGSNNNAALDDCVPTEGGCSPGPTPVNGGTIMSYCHLNPNVGVNFNNGFGQEPGDLIRSRYANADCTLSCDFVCMMVCPNDVTITCDQNYTNLGTTGEPTVYCPDGAYFLDHTDELFLNNCAGYVLRTFTLNDGSETSSCTQRIDIVEPYEPPTGTASNVFFNCYGDEISNNFYTTKYIAAESAFFATGVHYNEDNSIYEGTFSKMDINGNLIWTKSYGSETYLSSFEYTDNGHFILMGRKGLSNNNYSIYVVETDATGALVKSKTLARSGRIQGNKMIKNQSDAKGETYTIAHWKSNGGASDDVAVLKIDRNLDVLWSADYVVEGDDQNNLLIPMVGGGCLLAGHASGLSWNGFACALDTDGLVLGARRFTNTAATGYFEIRAAKITQDENLVLVAQDAADNAHILKLNIENEDTEVIWSKQYNHNIQNTFTSIAEDLDGNLYTSAYLPFDGNNKFSVFKLDNTGFLIWAKHLNSTGPALSYRSSAIISTTHTMPDRLILRDFRIPEDGFGQRDAILAVLDTDLNSCETMEFEATFQDADISISNVEVNRTETTYVESLDDVTTDLTYQQKAICSFAPNTFANCYGDELHNSISQAEYSIEKNAFYAVGARRTDNNSILEGTFSKLDIYGNILWTKAYGVETRFSSFAPTDDGNFILLGLKGLSDNNYSLFIIKVDEDGNLLQDKTFARTGRIRSNRISKSIADPLGETFIINHWKANSSSTSDDMAVFKIDANLNLLWSYDYYVSGDDQIFNTIPLNGGASLLVAGSSGLNWNGFLTQLDENGTVIQAKRYYNTPTNGFSEFRNGIQTQDGGFALVSMNSSLNAQLLKIDANLEVIWANEYIIDGVNQNRHSGLVEDTNGNLYVSSYLPIDGENKLRVLKYTNEGNLIWAKHLGTSLDIFSATSTTFLSHTNTSPDRLILRDLREPINGFGLQDEVLVVLDTDLTSCETLEYTPNVNPITVLSADITVNTTTTTYTEDNDAYTADLNYNQKDICGDTPSNVCSALSFENDYVEISPSLADNLQETDFTFEAWIKGTDADQPAHPTIFSNRQSTSEGFVFFLHNNHNGSANKLLAVQLNSSNYTLANSPLILDGTCHHVAITKTGTELKYYIDGEFMGTRIAPANPGMTSVHELWIGRDFITQNGGSFNGLIEEVRIWNAARSDADIQSTYQERLVGNEANLVAYYDMDEMNGQQLLDKGSNAYHGTLGSTNQADDSDPTWIEECCPDETSEGPLTFIIDETCGAVGEMVSIPVSVENFINVNGFQYSIHIDPAFATINSVSDFGLMNWSTGDFTINPATGTITLTWEASDISAGESVADNSIIFNINVEIIGTPGTNTPMFIDGNPTPIAVAQNLEEVTPVLEQGQLCITETLGITGEIYTWWDDSPICDVSVNLSGDETANMVTGATGTYEFNPLMVGSHLTVRPSKSLNPANGVNIFDVIAIRRHILNLAPFDNPYQHIAADATGEGNISFIDIVQVKRVIQGDIPNFPNNASWRFIPDDLFFTSFDNIFPFEQERNYTPLNNSELGEHYKGIKIGDVTGNAVPDDCTPLMNNEVNRF